MRTKSENIVQEIATNKVATEQQINLICKRLNNGEKIDITEIWDNPASLTKEQNKKGFDFLYNQWKTPMGKERLNNPFGYREEAILENFTGFEFAGVYDAGNFNRSFFVPLYNCCGNNNAFQYYFSSGKINIVG